MIEDKTCDMSDRFRTDRWFITVFGSGANNRQICPPFGGSINNFTFWSSLSLYCFRAGEIAQPFVQNILSRIFFSFSHFMFP